MTVGVHGAAWGAAVTGDARARDNKSTLRRENMVDMVGMNMVEAFVKSSVKMFGVV
jgi:hypothetical protein